MPEPTAEKFDTQTRGHHPDSPSSLQSSEACAAFENEQRESKASADGTLQHKAAETRDLSLLDGNEDWIAAVEKCIEYEDRCIGEFKASRLPHRVVREKYLYVGDEKVGDFFGVTGGFPDTLIVGEKHAILLDWKFGRVPVTPTKDNLQGIAYALGAFQLYPTLETVRVDFFAPHQRWDTETQRLKYSYTFRRDEFAKLELRIRTVVARKHAAYDLVAKGDWSYATPKHDLCLWCSRKGVCPKVAALVIQANEKYSELTVPDEIKHYRLTRPEQVAHAYRFASQLTPIIEAIKKRCVEVSLLEDLKPDGFAIVKQQKRSVKKVSVVIDLAVEHGLARDEVIELLSVPLTSVEDELKAKAAKGKGALKVREFAAALEEAGATELGKPIYFLREVKTPAEKQPAIEV